MSFWILVKIDSETNFIVEVVLEHPGIGSNDSNEDDFAYAILRKRCLELQLIFPYP